MGSASWTPTLPGLKSRSCSSSDKSLSSLVSKDSMVSSKNRRQAFSSAERWSRLSSLCDTGKKDSLKTVFYSMGLNRTTRAPENGWVVHNLN